MIEIYTGTPGSGKSLHAASVIYWKLRRGLPVICNFDINLSIFKKDVNFTCVDNLSLTPDFLIKYARNFWKNKRLKEDYITVVIDEAQLLFNAREWNVRGRSDWLAFFTQHRKYGFRIILIAQFDNMIDKQIRSLIEYQTVHRKVSNFGAFGKIMSIFAFGKLFVGVKVWYPLKEKIDHDFFKCSKKYCSLYDTYLTLDDAGEVSDLSDTRTVAAGE